MKRNKNKTTELNIKDKLFKLYCKLYCKYMRLSSLVRSLV